MALGKNTIPMHIKKKQNKLGKLMEKVNKTKEEIEVLKNELKHLLDNIVK